MDTPEAIARAHKMRAALALPGGQLVANPILPGDEIPAAELAPLIAQALCATRPPMASAARRSTPYLLQRLFDLTEGRTLTANIALGSEQCPACRAASRRRWRVRGEANRHRGFVRISVLAYIDDLHEA